MAATQMGTASPKPSNILRPMQPRLVERTYKRLITMNVLQECPNLTDPELYN